MKKEFWKGIASWKECLEYNSAFKITPNKEKAKSLIETADERINSSLRKLNKKTANFIFEDYYSSILELLHAIIILDGYKIINHVCLGYYLKDILKKENLFLRFDDLRYKRNSLTYYGKRMDFETAKNSIKQCKDLIKNLKNLLKNENNQK